MTTPTAEQLLAAMTVEKEKRLAELNELLADLKAEIDAREAKITLLHAEHRWVAADLEKLRATVSEAPEVLAAKEKTPRRPKGWLDDEIERWIRNGITTTAENIADHCDQKQSLVNASLRRMVGNGRLIRNGEHYELPTTTADREAAE